jgi:hypothetical protein
MTVACFSLATEKRSLGGGRRRKEKEETAREEKAMRNEGREKMRHVTL